MQLEKSHAALFFEKMHAIVRLNRLATSVQALNPATLSQAAQSLF